VLNLIRKAIGINVETGTSPARNEQKVELLAAVILLEAAQSDYDCSADEILHVIETIASMFRLPHEYVEELIEFAKGERGKAVDIYCYTRQVNELMGRDEKLSILEAVWRIIYVDGQIDKHEEHFARKLANLLWLEHRDFIEAKLKARPK